MMCRLPLMFTDCTSRNRSEAPRKRLPFDADWMTMRALDPRGITTSPLLSSASRVICASKVCPSAALPESIASFVRTETSLPAGNT